MRWTNRILLSIFLTMICLQLFAEKQLIRIYQPSEMFVREAFNSHADIGLYKLGESIDMIVSVEETKELAKTYKNLKVLQTEAEMRTNLKSKSRTIAGYHSYNEMLTDLTNYANENPEICQLVDLGETYGAQYIAQNLPGYNGFNHHLYGVKVSDNVAVEEDEPCVYIFGTHHAREPLGMEMSLYILNYLLTNYETDAEIEDLINNTQIWFIPLVNPDGYKVVYDETDLWWRKNIHDNNENGQFDTSNNYGLGEDGIDINRNYGWNWGYFSATDNFFGVTYHGTEAFSEIESRIVKNLIDSHHFVAGIGYHTYGGLVLYPWGGQSYLYAPDYEAMSSLADNMAATIDKTDGSGNTYTSGSGWQLYPASGGLDDYAYGQDGIFSYTIEMAETFIPEPTGVEQTKINNLQAALMMMKRVQSSTLTGLVTNAENHPLDAIVYVEGIDNTGVPRLAYQADSLYGRYYRMLNPGFYETTFYKTGFIPSTSYVGISENSQTLLNVVMVSAQSSSLSGNVYKENGDPIDNCRIVIKHNIDNEILTDANGHFLIETLFSGKYPIEISKQGVVFINGYIELQEGMNTTTYVISNSEYQDNFESGNLNWIRNGSWGLTGSESFSGGHCLTDSPEATYMSYENSYCRYPVSITLSNCQNASVSFMAKYNIGLNDEFAAFEISTDNINWEALEVFNGIQNDWVEKRYNLNHLIGHPLYLRFIMETSYSSIGEGIFIDDFRLDINDTYQANHEEVINIPVNKLISNYPNPFNPETNIKFEISKAQDVEIDIYNIKGQRVKTLKQNFANAGTHVINWKGQDNQGHSVSSGVYFYKMKNSQNQTIKKMILIK